MAVALTDHDVIRAHARDELGIDLDALANPLQAGIVSALCFSGGGLLPLLSSIFIADKIMRLVAVLISTTVGLIAFGILGAWLGGAGITKGGLRVLLGGWAALGEWACPAPLRCSSQLVDCQHALVCGREPGC